MIAGEEGVSGKKESTHRESGGGGGLKFDKGPVTVNLSV